jgi:hypothetical protein
MIISKEMRSTIITLSIIAIIAGSCRQAGTEINSVDSLINNEIFGEDETFWEYSPVKKSDWEGVDCDLYIDRDNVTKTQYCIFPKANLQQVYDIVKQIDANLKTKLPADNIDYFITKGDAKYKFESKYELFIVLNYDVNVTIIHIKEGENKTESWISHTEKHEDSDCFIDTDWEGAKCKYYSN